MNGSRTLIAGIGNVFLGDDGFGVEVVRQLAARPARAGVSVVDFGIRGVDLTYALLEHERVILVDAVRRGAAPGTLYVIEPDLAALAVTDTGALGHGVDPAHALSKAQALGAQLGFVRLVGCEPARLPDDDEIAVGLSPPVEAAVPVAVALVEELLEACDA